VSADSRKTSGSFRPANPASTAVRMSMSGDLRFSPRTIRPSRSASAWNLILKASSPQLGDQFRVRVPRMRMLGFGHLLAFGKIGVDLLLIGQIICECAMHCFEGQCRVTFNHAFHGHPFAEEIN